VDRCAPRKHLEIAERLDWKIADLAEVIDRLTVDDDQRRIVIRIPQFILDLTNQFIDGAEPVAFDPGLIEIALRLRKLLQPEGLDTADPSLVLDQPWAPSARTRVDGPLDINTTGPVEAALRLAGAAGTRNLTVDLTGVSHLGSAGVAALHRLTASHRASGTSLELYAPTGGPAETILTVVNLDHLTSDPHASAASGM